MKSPRQELSDPGVFLIPASGRDLYKQLAAIQPAEKVIK